uniref:Glycophorin-A n=1 Tax=Macrostomum lignano TaxID=282301 RepID=A0A1I8GL91_9PLAT
MDSTTDTDDTTSPVTEMLSRPSRQYEFLSSSTAAPQAAQHVMIDISDRYVGMTIIIALPVAAFILLLGVILQIVLVAVALRRINSIARLLLKRPDQSSTSDWLTEEPEANSQVSGDVYEEDTVYTVADVP